MLDINDMSPMEERLRFEEEQRLKRGIMPDEPQNSNQTGMQSFPHNNYKPENHQEKDDYAGRALKLIAKYGVIFTIGFFLGFTGGDEYVSYSKSFKERVVYGVIVGIIVLGASIAGDVVFLYKLKRRKKDRGEL